MHHKQNVKVKQIDGQFMISFQEKTIVLKPTTLETVLLSIYNIHFG